MTKVRFSNVSKSYGPVQAIGGHFARRQFRRVHHDPRAERLGKDDDAVADRRHHRADFGSIELGDREITYVPAAQRNIGLVFQSYALFPHMSIFDNIAFPLRVRKLSSGEVADRVAEALRLVRLTGFEKRRPHPAFRRPAAARRAGTRHRVQAGYPASRRAVGRTRPQAARGGPLRDPRAAAQPRHHHHHGHPRPGGGAVAVRPRSCCCRAARWSRSARRTRSTHRPKHALCRRLPRSRQFRRRHARPRRRDPQRGTAATPASMASGHARGSQVCGLIRPRISAPIRKAASCSGVVRDVVFLGEVARYSVEVESGRMLTVNVGGARAALPGRLERSGFHGIPTASGCCRTRQEVQRIH